ncbi:MAG: response regulator [Flavitalea sp.]
MSLKEAIHIMLVDDDREDRELFASAINEFDLGFSLTVVENGTKALDLLAKEETSFPDIIFLDLRMPKISGKNVLIQLKQNPRCAGIPIVILTTSTDNEEAKQLRDLGATHFCSKPSDPEELYFVISLALEEALPAD